MCGFLDWSMYNSDFSVEPKMYIWPVQEPAVYGSEFGIHKGKYLVYRKSLYGLKTSAARWHETLSTTLCTLKYEPSKADSDLWMRNHKTHYEYIVVYVDDLLLWEKPPS